MWLGEGCSTLDHYGRGFVLIRLGTNAPDVSALKSEAEVRSENDTGPGYQEGWRSADLHDAAGSFSNRWLDGFFDPHVGEGQVAPRPVAIPAHAGRRRGKKISGASPRDSFVLEITSPALYPLQRLEKAKQSLVHRSVQQWCDNFGCWLGK